MKLVTLKSIMNGRWAAICRGRKKISEIVSWGLKISWGGKHANI